MKAIFTGLNGTVAPFAKAYFEEKGYEVIPFKRDEVSTDDKEAMLHFIREVSPKLIIHFAMGSSDWAASLAEIAKLLKIKFVYISTVSVFSNDNLGPHDIRSIPDAMDDYGIYKRRCEDACLVINKDSYIVRLGWQIGYEKGSNQMVDFLYRKMEIEGVIHASSKWYPACSFLKDTASALYDIVTNHQPDLYLVDSNDGFNFFEIVTKLQRLHPSLVVKESTDFKANHRMIDERVKINKLSKIL